VGIDSELADPTSDGSEILKVKLRWKGFVSLHNEYVDSVAQNIQLRLAGIESLGYSEGGEMF
jgi:hypothetical protein